MFETVEQVSVQPFPPVCVNLIVQRDDRRLTEEGRTRAERTRRSEDLVTQQQLYEGFEVMANTDLFARSRVTVRRLEISLLCLVRRDDKADALAIICALVSI
jgi:hypothetical protein